MKKVFAIAAAASVSAMVPSAASATTFITGDQIQCSTSSFPSSRCNGVAQSVKVVDDTAVPEFFINVVPVNGSANPLITADFANGIITLKGLGTQFRTFTGTVLSFANLTKPWATVSVSPGSQLAGKVAIVGGVLRITLTGTSWNQTTTETLAVTAVPEPGTWMLMILGLGAVGFAMRRRQTVSARLQFA